MEIATQLTEEQAKKLALIQEKTKQSPEQILGAALEYYCQQVLTAPNNHLVKFSQIGFVGCIEAEPNLAETAESILNQYLGATKGLLSLPDAISH